MKVYIFTQFLPMGAEHIFVVASSIKKGEKEVRKKYPYMRPDGERSYILDPKKKILGRVQEWEVDAVGSDIS